ncbi:ABC transporter permease [Shewanella intestini]|uniref:ABC transporter permease n=1 Tax=Shewanella intestini TaxID=2017544 RepID=A0ABS5I1P1_9GAMM|nr:MULTISPECIES: ABC transporter permease [Shewanella]MBR9727937.1 ABC transporter permease [Shewanella intestini]MRG36512.1 ABC transporter permease subunit [Shewanella sp. XMDDZSB0408]
MKALLALIQARNLEFSRDKSAIGWSLLFPIIILIALALVFDDDSPSLYRVGVYGPSTSIEAVLSLKHIDIIHYDDLSDAQYKVARHHIDGLVSAEQYWINPTSARGYIVEQLILAQAPSLQKTEISGEAVRHVEWLLPGIIGMNMMFSGLYGVGYVIVRYRRTGVLKRFQVTPLSAWQFLSSQLLSRLLVILATAVIVFVVICTLFTIEIKGSAWLLLLNMTLGTAAMISIGLMVASRTRSDEWCNGVLNLLSWPMMFLSGIWFSLEGSKDWVRLIADMLPLTHLNDANRAVIIDGAGIVAIGDHLLFLVAIITVSLSLASYRFKWQ